MKKKSEPKPQFAYVKSYSEDLVSNLGSNLLNTGLGGFIYEWKFLLKNNIRVVKLYEYYEGNSKYLAIDADYLYKKYKHKPGLIHDLKVLYGWILYLGDGVDTVIIPIDHLKDNII